MTSSFVLVGLRRALPWLLLGTALGVALQVAVMPLSNPDTWLHLSVGRQFVNGWSIRNPGGLTPFADLEWTPTQWSTQLLMAWVNEEAGYGGIRWLFGLFFGLLVAGLYMLCRADGGAPASAAATLIALVASSSALSVRPQVVGLVLLIATAAVWRKTARDLKPRWWLLPLTWISATAHGFWSIGIALGAATCLGLVLDRGFSDIQVRRVLLLPPLALVVAMLTPAGPSLVAAQLVVSARSGLITEWAPTTIRGVAATTAILMLAAIGILWSRGARVPWVELIWWLFAAAAALYAIRLVAVGAVVAAPLLAGALGRMRTRSKLDASQRRHDWDVRWMLPTLLLVFVVSLTALLPLAKPDVSNVPRGLSPQLERLPRGSVVFVDGVAGAWIEYEFPHINPTLEALFDAYELEYLRDYQRAITLQPGWENFVERTGADAALLAAGGPVEDAMIDRLGWRRVATVDRWVFLKPPRR